MKLVDAEQMRAIDGHTINVLKIPSLELMENAGQGIFEYIKERILPAFESPRIAIVCGRGNNGGDGFVVGRHLLNDGQRVDFFLAGNDEKLSSDCRANYEKVISLEASVKKINDDANLPDLSNYDLIVDAIFGTGFSGAAQAAVMRLIERINAAESYIVAIDAPSGLDVSTGQVSGPAVVADSTTTLALPKPGLFVSPGRELAGTVAVIPIGIPDEAIAHFNLRTNLITGNEVTHKLPVPRPDGHKGDFGKVAIIAASPGLTGAAALSGLAAARSGSGLVTVGVPESLNPILEAKLTEVMTTPLPELKKRGVLALRARGEIRRFLEGKDAAALGPGLGRHHETIELVRRLISDLRMPAIIDADGLSALSGDNSPLLAPHGPLVLTPHPGEFERLTAVKPDPNPINNYALVAEWAQKFQSVIVLKGSPTLVVSPDGEIYLNPTGNWGMATGGSGDVLTGIIVALLGQRMSPVDAAVCGVYIHGLAGDLAVEDIHPRSLIASDLIDHLSAAFQTVA